MNPLIQRSSVDGPRPTFRAGEDAIEVFAFLDPRRIGLQPLPDACERQAETLCVGSIAALIGFACIDDYCGPGSASRLADVAWLGPRARRHAELIRWAMELSPVFPVPFGTLYSSLESLTTFMRAHETTIGSFLRTASENEEWELRAAARLDHPSVMDRLARKAWPEWESLPKGARYLRLCRDRSALAAFANAQAAAAASRVVARLKPMAMTIQERSAAESEFAARHALLVPKSNVDAVRERVSEAVAELNDGFAAFSLSGPMPPFSFRPRLDFPPSRQDHV